MTSQALRRPGVCSWSLQPDSPETLARLVRATGLERVQLSLKPLHAGNWDVAHTVEVLSSSGVSMISGMMTLPGEDYSTLESIRRTGGLASAAGWRSQRKVALNCADLARDLELPLVSFHAGFMPHDRADPQRARLLERLGEVADIFAERGVALALETGQESARTLVVLLEDLGRANVGVNFDPANMLLYDMGDPLAALETLAPWVRQVHIKDAQRTEVPGTWGQELPVGEGQVDWTGFFDVLQRREIDVELMIEREAGEDRVGDVALARRLIEGLRPGAPSAASTAEAADARVEPAEGGDSV
jgi:L-ribulose-5-phosphate 3-epimerase